MKTLLSKIYHKLTLQGIKNYNEVPDIDEWEKFLRNLPTASNPEQRSLNKYYCRMYYFGLLYKVIVNIVSSILLLIYVIPQIFRNGSIKRLNSTDAVLVEDNSVGFHDIIPDKLIERYSQITIVSNVRKGYRISKEGKKLFLSIWKNNIFRPHYSYWIFRELVFHSCLVERYSPKAIIVYVNERNIASPIIKEYLESKNIKFITFMHGDYILQLIQGFMDFSEFYVWDTHYIKMFVDDLYCPEKQFIVYTPKKLKKKYDLSEETIDLTYYLGSESDATIKKIGSAFKELKAKGKKCQVRLHPRRDHLEKVIKFVDHDQIQYPKDTPIDLSISQSLYIVSINSTVMLESSFGGKRVMLDDWSDPEAFQSLVDRKGIILDKPHYLLTQYLKKEIDDTFV